MSIDRKRFAVICLFFLLSPSALAETSKQAKLDSGKQSDNIRVLDRFPDKNDSGETSKTRKILTDTRLLTSSELQTKLTLGQWKEASTLLDAKDTSDSVKLAFLDAYIAYKQDNYDKSLRIYKDIEPKSGLLKGHIRYFAAVSAYELGEPQKAVEWAGKVQPESQFHPDALLLLAKGLNKMSESSDLKQAEKLLELHQQKYPESTDAAEAKLLLGKILEKQGSINAAAQSYLNCIRHHPTSAHAEQAKKRFRALSDQLSPSLKDDLDKLENSPSYILRKSERLFYAHDSRRVIDLLTDAHKSWEKGASSTCKALYFIGKSYSKLRDHSTASNWYRKIRNQCEGTGYRLKALYLGGKGYWNIDQRESAREWFRTIWTEFPEHSYADDAFYFAARSFAEVGNHDDAEKLLHKQLKRYPNGDMAADAHWMLVRQMFRNNNHRKVIQYVDSVDQNFPKDLYNDGRLSYFKARALEKVGKPAEADKLYEHIVKYRPLTYYALMAFNRLGTKNLECENGSLCSQLGQADSAKLDLPKDIKGNDSFKRGVTFIQVGLTDLAGREFKSLYHSYQHKPKALWGLAKMLDKAQAYHLSHNIPRHELSGWKSGYPESEKANPRWRLAYPQAFRETVDKYASKFEIPSSFVFGLMREESAFQPSVKSWANARGLLQLMSGTAKNMARKLNVQYDDYSDLLNIDTNVHLGIGYMRDLADHVGVRPPLIAAGYNAGYGNVSNWLEGAETRQLDLWIEDIPYGQTRHYTKRVLSSYWAYTWLYEQKVPNLNLTVPKP
jgi:soluble lytic murein transglycosylase